MSLSSEGREEGYKLSGAKPGPGLGVKVKDDDEINNWGGWGGSDTLDDYSQWPACNSL